MRNLLVTGGAGFIGSNFVRMVLSEHPEYFVLNLDLLTYAGNLKNLEGYLDHPRHRFVRGNIGDYHMVSGIVQENDVQFVVNFAAESHVDRSITDPKVFIETNVLGTLNLLEVARDHKVERFVQVSTDEVYGSLGSVGLFSETTLLSPNSPYSASKAAADHLVRAFGHTYGISYSITRCSNNYGPYQFPEKLIPLMINNARKNRPLPVYGDGLNLGDWLFVDDHCTAIWKVLTEARSGEIYNIGGCNEMANIDLVKRILAHLGKPDSLIRYVADRQGHDRRYAIDAQKIMKELGWKPSVTPDEGLRRTIEWYLTNESWLDAVVSGDYQKYYETLYGEAL